jgi:hypothetical protein
MVFRQFDDGRRKLDVLGRSTGCKKIMTFKTKVTGQSKRERLKARMRTSPIEPLPLDTPHPSVQRSPTSVQSE